MKRIQRTIHIFITLVFTVAVLFSVTGMDMTVAESVSVADNIADVKTCVCHNVHAGMVSSKVYGKSGKSDKSLLSKSFKRIDSGVFSNISMRNHAARYSLSYNHLFCTFLI